MNSHYSLLKVVLPDQVISQIIEEIGDLRPVHFLQLHIPYIDKFIEAHNTILDRCYGLYITSTILNAAVSPTPKFIDVVRVELRQKWMSYLIEPTIEVDRATLHTGQCMLLNTQVPHAVRNATRVNRLVLSINCKVSYQEAYEYFANLGLIEVNVLDIDRPLL